ncbi:ABC transporter transmembrane domain-containing protein, partial [Streptomyces sp. NPDC000410]|uniref:ABC transporter transmembrane domain-containing protein n=1 Tax=Streptomyces sp. NPDC000410 TaxID=3154254 RepID=UPI003320F46C
MTATGFAQAKDQSTPPSDAHPETGQSAMRLLRPYGWRFAAVVILQVVGAVVGLAPLLAVAELGRVLLSPGPVDRGRVWWVVFVGVAGLFVRLVFTAASSGVGHVLDGRVQLSLRRQLAAGLGRVPMGWFSRRRAGELAKVVGEDVSAVHP